MENYKAKIEQAWETRSDLTKENPNFKETKEIVDEVISQLEKGQVVVAEKNGNDWTVNEWVKKAILLNFRTSEMKIYDGGVTRWYDKIDPRFAKDSAADFEQGGYRVVPGAYIRSGTYIGKNAVIMPSYVNIGAYVGEGTLVDTWATIGSCAQIGKNCHISGGAGIGGVLEPLQANPVIIEDDCFIGARSEIVEGVIVEKGAVISMGVFIGASTKIVSRATGEITYGRVPAYSVVVPGTLPGKREGEPGLYCAVIIKQVDEKTRSKTSLNELLRD